MGTVTGYSTLLGTGKRNVAGTPLILVTTTITIPGGSGTIDNLVDGDFTASTAHAVTNWSSAVSGLEIRFQLVEPSIITKIKNYQSGTANEGTYNFQGSPDGTTWTTIGSFTFSTGTQEDTFTNTTAYLYYRFFGTSGSVNSGPWWEETEFFCTGDDIEIGDRRSIITASTTASISSGTAPLLVDGTTSGLVLVNSQAVSGLEIRFAFSTSVTLTGFVWDQDPTIGNMGVWQPQVSTNGSSWTNVGSTITLGSTAGADGYTWANTTGFPFFRLLGVSGSTNATLLAIKEVRFIGTGPTTPTGTWASTEATDIFAAVGYPGAAGILGNLLSTEAPDIFAALGFASLVGTMSAQEATDIFSAFGTQPITGTLTATERPDIFSAIGIGRGENGVFITTEAVDIFTAIGNTPISGTFNTTEAADRFFAIGAGVTRVRRRRQSFIT